MKRFTIINLMPVLLFIALGFAALRSPLSTALGSGIFSLT